MRIHVIEFAFMHPEIRGRPDREPTFQFLFHPSINLTTTTLKGHHEIYQNPYRITGSY